MRPTTCKLTLRHLTVTCAMALLSACATTGGGSTESGADNSGRPGVEQFGRTPLPVGTKVRTNDSLILGVGDNWLGRAVFEVPTDAASSFAFFADQFPRQGWTAVSAMRGKKSLLVFTRGDRSATLEMEEGSLFGNAIVVVTVSPMPSASNPPAAAGNPGVVVQPIGQPRR
jgi:hypothetical protein